MKNTRNRKFLFLAPMLTVVLLTAASAHATINVVQDNAGEATSASSEAVAFSSNTTAGNLILVGFDFASGASFSSISDTKGDTFVEVGSQLTTPAGSGSRLYYAKNIVGGADTVTVHTTASASFIKVQIVEYSGLSTSTPIDVQDGNTGSAGTAYAGGTTTVADDMIFGFLASDGTGTAAGGFTTVSAANGNVIINDLAGAPGSYSSEGSSTSGWSMQMAALEPSSTVQVDTPTFSPGAGTYTTAQSVSISDGTSGATIYYTTNDTTPTTSSSVYSSAIDVSASETLEALATYSGDTNSAVGTAAYTINIESQVDTPTFSPAAGSYTTAQSVSISDGTSGATIYYTTNDTTPTTSSSVYSSAIDVSATETLEALATHSGDTNSTVATGVYTIGSGINVVQDNAGEATSASSEAVAFSFNTNAGDIILVGFDFASGSTFSSISDTKGDTFAEVGSQLTTPAGSGSRLYYAKNIVGGADTVTVHTTASASFIKVQIVEYSGVSTSSPIDVQDGNTGSAGSAYAGGTTTVADDMIFGFLASDGTGSAAGGFTSVSTEAGNVIINDLAGSPGSYSSEGSSTAGWSMQMAALEPGSGSQVATPTFSPGAGTYTTAQSVSISDSTSGSTIYYTTNDTTPTTSSSVYSSAINVTATETLEALATHSGDTNSSVGTAAYTISSGSTCDITASLGVCPSSGLYYDTSLSPVTWGEITQNDVWGAGSVTGTWTQELYTTSPGDWYVVANFPTSTGEIFTYPSAAIQYSEDGEYNEEDPTLDSFTEIVGAFNLTVPSSSTGVISDIGYDMWFNAWASEVMIQHDLINTDVCTDWTTVIKTDIEFGGSNGVPDAYWNLCQNGTFGSSNPELIWQYYATSGSKNFGVTNSSVDVYSMLKYLEGNSICKTSSGTTACLPSSTTLTQFAYGFEISTTDGVNQTFTVNSWTQTAVQ